MPFFFVLFVNLRFRITFLPFTNLQFVADTNIG